MLRIDTAETFLGVRLNVFTSIVVGLLAVAYLVAMRGRPREVITRGADQAASRDRAEQAPRRDDGSAVEATGEQRTPSPDEGGRPASG
jgi:hypothetical protein